MRIGIESCDLFPVNTISFVSCVFIVYTCTVHVDEGYVSCMSLSLRMFVCILQFYISVFLGKETGITVSQFLVITNVQ